MTQVHEYSMTAQIVESILVEADKRGAKKVTEVHLTIGRFTFLGLDQVRFSYGVLTKGTVMEGSRLLIEEKEGSVRCRECGFEGSIRYENDPEYHVSYPTLLCSKCSGVVELVEGRECTVKNIKMVI